MDLGLKGRKALVGGASKGLGLAAAQALAAEGCKVAIVSRPEELGALVAFLASQQASGITGAGIPADGGMLQGLLS